MRNLKTTTLLSISMASMAVTLFFMGMQLGLLPNNHRKRLDARARLCETIATQLCTTPNADRQVTFDRLAPTLVSRNPEIRSLGIRNAADNRLAMQTETHAQVWQPMEGDSSQETQVQIPIYEEDQLVAWFEICLLPIYNSSWQQSCEQLHLPMVAFLAIAGFLAFKFYLHRSLQHLDPTTVIPERVKAVLDILSDGVVMTDEKGQIVLANDAFQHVTDKPMSKLLGKTLSTLKWIQPAPQNEPKGLPWVQALREGATCKSIPLMLEKAEAGEYHNSLVSVTPILGGNGKQRGILASFTDVTELERTNRELVEMSRRAGMAEIATDILHNVGNILNSVNVATSVIAEKIANSKVDKLHQVGQMMEEHQANLGTYLTEDPKGQHIPIYISKMSALLVQEQQELLETVETLTGHVNHIKEIVRSQQSYARVATCEVPTDLPDVVESAIGINSTLLHQSDILVVRECSGVNIVTVDKPRVLQILANLVRNAADALRDCEQAEKRMVIRLLMPSPTLLHIEVIDNGVGIPAENLTKIFQHGFTTKPDGHGFGLHSSVLSAKEMGGSLTAHSEGIGQGACFRFELPLKIKENAHDTACATESASVNH
ncbi:ATP-binding protein [Planctomycetota bacterium]